MPSHSPGRGRPRRVRARQARSGTTWTSRSTTVVFPVPEGAETTNSSPRAAAHSTFCTCSRIFSSSAFSADDDLRHAGALRPWSPSVLTSRFISCSRKSSLRPHGSGASDSARQCSRCARKRTVSSVMSDRFAKRTISCAIAASSTAGSARSSRTRCQSRPQRLRAGGRRLRGAIEQLAEQGPTGVQLGDLFDGAAHPDAVRPWPGTPGSRIAQTHITFRASALVLHGCPVGARGSTCLQLRKFDGAKAEGAGPSGARV